MYAPVYTKRFEIEAQRLIFERMGTHSDLFKK